ncbi:alpha/beta hydrolase [Parendozoicomonas sp. Alg238-R29]|uniref:alpha/beta fold hydrolase n=1 Tax=Parendozoicomonas sp. Alg238-R29 TaxID=2993446 RepID=UPI00248D8A8B|nr:alpha/beta hydrolase [Parendozoicomonas sp. Alg238-R29]
MPKLKVNDIDIAYEDHGPADGSVFLLIHGLGTPLTGWPRSYWQPMVDAGWRVLLIDNRDVGESSPMKGFPLPSLKDLALASVLKKRISAGYTLNDMATDAIGLLDALNITKAHVVGASMGGMIGQILAAQYSERITSLSAIMTSTGARHLPGPALSVQWRLIQKSKDRSPEGMVRHSMKIWKVIGSPDYPTAEQSLYEYVYGIHKRGVSASGYMRHMAAIMASGDRTPMVQEVQVPSLVIHGSADLLVPVECGRHLAEQIPGTVYHEVPGMGHDFPEQLAPSLTTMILDHARQSENAFQNQAFQKEKIR